MPTETQKNFRKQMEAHKKNSAENGEKVFSYIENDMISDYYSIKPKRIYKKSIPVATILLLTITIGFKIYSYTTTNPLNISIGNSDKASIIKQSANSGAIIHNKKNNYLSGISIFLESINNLKQEQNEIIDQYNSSIADYKNGIITKKGFIIQIEKFREQVNLISGKIDEINVVEGTENYYSLIKTSISLQGSLFEAISIQQKTGDVKYNKEISDLMNKISINSIQIRKALINIFDELGIEYNINSEGIVSYIIKY